MEAWRGNVFEPSNAKSLPKNLKEAPNIQVIPEYIFGYKTKDTRNNLKYLSNNTIAYHAGTIVIIQDLTTNSQKLFVKHKEEIQAFAVSKQSKLVAAGDINKNKSNNKPAIIVWNYENEEEVVSIDSLTNKGFIVIAFNPAGNLLACVTADDEHSIFVIELNNEKREISNEKAGKNKVLDVSFRTEKVVKIKFSRNSQQWV